MVVRSYFRKLLASYIAVVILASIFMVSLHIILINPKIKKYEVSQAERILEHIVNTTDLIITETWNTAYNHSLDPQFLQVSSTAEKDIFLISQVIDRVDNIKNTNENVYSVYLYLDKHKRIIASHDWYFSSWSFYDMHWLPVFRAQDEEPMLMSREIFIHEGMYHQTSDTIPVITLMIKLRNQQGVLVYNLYAKKLFSIYHELQGEKNHLIILDENGKLVANTGSLPSSFLRKNDIKELADSLVSERWQQLRIDGKEFGAVSRTSDVTGWKFIDLNPMVNLTLTTRTIALFSILSAVLFILTGIIFTFFLTRKMYTPIHSLLSVIRDNDSADTSESIKRFDEFLYLNNRFQNLSSREQEKEEIYKGNTKLARAQFLNLLVKGQIPDTESIGVRLEQLKILFPYPQYVVATLILDNWERLSYIYNQREIQSIRTKIEEFVLDTGKQENLYITVLPRDLNRIVLILNMGKEKNINACIEWSKKLQTEIQVKLELTVSIGIGEPVYELQNIFMSYHQSLKALEYKIVYGKNQIIYINDVNRGKESHFLDMYNIHFSEEEITTAIVRQQGDRIVEIFQTAAEKLISVGADFSYVRTIFFQYTALLSKVPYSLHLSNQSVLSEVTFQDITNNKTMPQMIHHIQKLASTILETYISEQSLDTNTRLVRDVGKYLEDHFDQNIGLETVADHFSVSKYHLSRVFKKVTNRNFNEQLLTLRMEKTKMLLKNPKAEIQEVAHSVGYLNSNSFRRVFKQRFGTSPSAYQQRYRETNAEISEVL